MNKKSADNEKYKQREHQVALKTVRRELAPETKHCKGKQGKKQKLDAKGF
jgi:hypothetical protein